jgi:hypothetical protein
VPGRALRCNGPRAGYLLTRCSPPHTQANLRCRAAGRRCLYPLPRSG